MSFRTLKYAFVPVLLSLLAAGCNLGSLTGGGGTPASAGVLRSANGGTDWQFSNAIKDKDATHSLSGTNISGLKFKPGSSDVLYASSYNNGLLISEDAGQSWTQILSTLYVYDFAFDPFNLDIIYAVGSGSGHGRVLTTRDAGKTWQELFTEGTADNAIRSIVVDPTTGKQLFAGLENGNIVRSDDGGLSWKLVTNLQTRISSMKWSGGQLYVMGKGKGIFVSRDGGQTFTNITGETAADTGIAKLFSGVGNYNQFLIGTTAMYIATDNGVFRSADGGAHWAKLILPLQNQGASILSVAISPFDDSIVYTAAESTIYKSTDAGQTWQTQNPHTSGKITALLVHPQNTQIVYAGVYAQ